MANPGYPPNMGGMPPQMQQPPMQRPPKQGTSKAVPVVVSAGLAVGVFCGLLFGLGTKKAAADAPVKMSSNGVVQQPDFVPESMAKDNGRAEIPKKPVAVAAVGSGGSGSDGGSAAIAADGSGGSGSAGSAAAPITATTPPRLIFEVTPDDAAKVATFTVDGKPVTGTSLDVPFDAGQDKKKVHVEVKATGFKDVTQDVDMEKADITVKFEMAKAPVKPVVTSTAASTFHPGGTTTHPASSTTAPVPHSTPHTTPHTTPPTGKKKPPGGGAVDI